MLKGLAWALALGYPFIVLFSLDQVGPRYLALLMAAVLLLRWRGGAAFGSLAVLAPAGGAFLLAAALAGEAGWLLAYPAFVNAALFAVFFASVLRPPSLAERLARLREPDLPPRAVAYTRNVTLVWCAFFAANGAAAAATAWLGDLRLWSLYNGFVAYVLTGLLMGGELLVRRQFKKRHEALDAGE